MKSKAALLVLSGLLCTSFAFAQEGGGGGRGGRGQGGGRGAGAAEQGGGGGRGQGGGGGRGAAAAPPAMDKVTPDIPGVVKAGTKLEIVKYGMGGTDSGTGMPDGSVLVSSGGKVLKMTPDGNSTTLVEDSEQAAGLTLDPKG